MDGNSEEARYRRAKARVDELKGFYIHIAVYAAVNLGLFLINWVTDGNWWFYWPLIGWGIGLAVHAFVVFGVAGLFGRDWEERKIREEMEREQRSGMA